MGKVFWRGSPTDPTLLLIPPIEDDANKPKRGKQAKVDKDNDRRNNNKYQRTKRLRFRVELHFGMDTLDWIQPCIRLVPNRCNLGKSATISHMYNHVLIQDASHCFMNDLESSPHGGSLKEKYPHLNDVVVLAKIWCLQRGLLNRHDGFTTEHIALLILYIYRCKLAGPRMGAPQALASFFKLLVETNWLGEDSTTNKGNAASDHNRIRKAPSEAYQEDETTDSSARTRRTVLVLPRDGETMDQTISEAKMAQVYAKQTKESPLSPDDPRTLLELYQTTYTLGPVLLDPSMTLNYLGRVSPSFVRLLQREARKGLDFLHSTQVTKPFQLLFMTEMRFFKRFDAYLQVPLKDFASKSTTSPLWGGEERSDLGEYENVARGLIRVLRAALGNRINDLQLLSSGNGRLPQGSNCHNENGAEDSDEIPCFPVTDNKEQGDRARGPPSLNFCSPDGREHIVLGISLNTDTCFRTVDRGPPAEDLKATQRFLALWGKDKAELRRFKDGAIVYAVVWDSSGNEGTEGNSPYFRFQSDDRIQGGIVERIIRHILRLHFVRKEKEVTSSFSLRNLLSTIDGVIPDGNTTVTFNPSVAHRFAMKAFEDFSSFLREESLPSISVPGSEKLRSRLGIPLQIDAVEPLDPTLRYVQLFPPIPHPLLGGSPLPGLHEVSTAMCSNPIRIQIRFGSSSKWPTDLKAIGAAKTAMLVQLVNGIEELMQQNAGKNLGFAREVGRVTPEYADICYKGYVFRVFVRADPELKFLRELIQPSDEAATLLRALTKTHVVAAKHHSMVHAVYASHPSSSVVVRAVQRWVGAHLFTGLFPFEAVELLVVHLYTDQNSPCDPPGSLTAGLMRFFHLLSSHDWESEPMVLDPQGHLNDEDYVEIKKEFDDLRGPQHNRGPSMFIVSPYDRAALDDDSDETPTNRATSRVSSRRSSVWRPTLDAPEAVVLGRARQLAGRSYNFLLDLLARGGEGKDSSCSALFQESSESFLAFSALLRVDPDLIFENESSSSSQSDLTVRRNEKVGAWQSSYTRSMYRRYLGPTDLRTRLFKNLMEQQGQSPGLLFEFDPVAEMVRRLRQELGHFAVFWYNGLCPDVVAVLWRPNIFATKSFSAVTSEYVRPVKEDNWQKDTLVTASVSDVMLELSCYTEDIVVDQKVFHRGMQIPSNKSSDSVKTKRSQIEKERSGDSDDSSEEETATRKAQRVNRGNKRNGAAIDE